jgi:DnaJ domain
MNELTRFYKILDLEPETSLEEVKKSYRDLVKVWHPDRFHDNQRLQKKANEKLRRINEAYAMLTLYLSHKTQFIAEELKEPIYAEQSKRDDQDRKTSYGFSEIDLVSLLGKSKYNKKIKHYLSSLNIKSQDIDRDLGHYCVKEYISYSRFKNIYNYSFKNHDFQLVFLSNILITICLYPQYIGNIPGDLRFSDDRQIIIKKIGQPSQSSRDYKVWGGSQEEVWDKWFFPKYSICVTYYNSGKISTIAVLKGGEPTQEKKGNWWQKLWDGLFYLAYRGRNQQGQRAGAWRG